MALTDYSQLEGANYVIWDTETGAPIDVAQTAAEAGNKSWWRKNAKVTTRGWYEKFAAEWVAMSDRTARFERFGF